MTQEILTALKAIEDKIAANTIVEMEFAKEYYAQNVDGNWSRYDQGAWRPCETPLTPVAFNWTPAMSAVFGQMRPSMSGLLAMWEAMHEAAVYKESQHLGDGWIEWGGGECPTHPDNPIEVRLENGSVFQDISGLYRWTKSGFATDIAAWRPAK